MPINSAVITLTVEVALIFWLIRKLTIYLRAAYAQSNARTVRAVLLGFIAANLAAASAAVTLSLAIDAYLPTSVADMIL